MRLLVLLSIVVTQSLSIEDVSKLDGQPGFRSIGLKWIYTEKTKPTGFYINYCENQVWGKFRCKKKILSGEDLNEIETENVPSGKLYHSQLKGLRMSTNYTIHVRPFEGDAPPTESRARSLPNEIYVQTKGFSARAINCLANNSLVEVETGPYFGGKISVEGSTDERCSQEGDYSATRSSYLININHYICGSEIFNTSVRTFIIVQENLPILTHSTRRFMVVCTYVPETFTVRAGVNLPYEGSTAETLLPIESDILEVDPSELFDATNDLFNQRSGRQAGRALKLSTEDAAREQRKWSHLVLMVVMIISAMVGLVIAAWKFLGHTKKRNVPAVDSSLSSIGGTDFDGSVPVSVATIEGAILHDENLASIVHDMNMMQCDVPTVPPLPEDEFHPSLVPHLSPLMVCPEPELNDLVLNPMNLSPMGPEIAPILITEQQLLNLNLDPNVQSLLVSDLADDSLNSTSLHAAQFSGAPHIIPTAVDPNSELPIFHNNLVPNLLPRSEETSSSDFDETEDEDLRPEDGNWRLKNEKGEIFAPNDPTI